LRAGIFIAIMQCKKHGGVPAPSFNLYEVFVKSDATVSYFLRNHEN